MKFTDIANQGRLQAQALLCNGALFHELDLLS